MFKNNTKKLIIIGIISVVIIFSVGFGAYEYNKSQSYTSLISTANKYMASGEYDRAIILFQQSLHYKKDSSIENRIELANSLKEVRSTYDEALNLSYDKKFLEAIAQFKKVTKEDETLYNNAQNKIQDCTQKYVRQYIELANYAAMDNKYDEANKYLDEALKVDADNKEVKDLKDSFAKTVKAQEEMSKVTPQGKTKAKKAKQKPTKY